MPDPFELQLETVAYMDSSPPQVVSVVVAQEPSPAVTGKLRFVFLSATSCYFAIRRSRLIQRQNRRSSRANVYVSVRLVPVHEYVLQL